MGRSAEGLGYFPAAEIYYRLSKAVTYRCAASPFNNCDGFVFPIDSDLRLNVVIAKNREATAPNDTVGRSPSTTTTQPPNSLGSSAKQSSEDTKGEPKQVIPDSPNQQAKQDTPVVPKQDTPIVPKQNTPIVPNLKRENPSTKETRVTIKDSEFEKQATFVGATQDTDNGGYFLRSWVDKQSGEITHQVYFFESYTGSWKFWMSASDEHANTLKVILISKDVGSCRYGCTLSEHIGIIVSDAIIRNRGTSEYRIKIKAQTGHEKIISLSNEMISAQLSAIDKYKTEKKLKTLPTKKSKDAGTIPL